MEAPNEMIKTALEGQKVLTKKRETSQINERASPMEKERLVTINEGTFSKHVLVEGKEK